MSLWTMRVVIRASMSLAYVLGCLCGIGCADQLLLYPSTAPASFGAARRQMIDDHGRSIEVFIAQSPGVQSHGTVEAYALEFTGNATRAEYVVNYLAKRWGDRSVEVWVMNYPGFGQSTGPASLERIPSSALATYDALTKEAQGRPIFICGASLGTSAALYVAANRPCAGMVLQNPPPLQRMILQRYGWVAPTPVVAQIPGELDSLINARLVKSPAVFILSGKDKTVPPQYQQMVVDAYTGPKHLVQMPQAYHNAPIEGEAREQFQRELDWLYDRSRAGE